MKEYHKIQSIYKRDQKTHKFIDGDFTLPEFEYLANNKWIYTEKIDGTNIRVKWDTEKVSIGGRTDNAQIPEFLQDKLHELLPEEKFREIYPETEMVLYGEGYGDKIQKVGKNYIKDGVSFILFDVKIVEYWLERHNVDDIAEKLQIQSVPVIGSGTVQEMIDVVKKGFNSIFGDFTAEGIVARPEVELFSRSGHRIITKIKHRDF